MTLRPDLVDAWIFRLVDGRPQVLMLRRSAVKVLSGLWQGVSGRVEGDESVVDAVLREVREETGIGPDAIEGLYSLDFVASFLWEPLDAVMSSVHFGIRVGPGIEPVLSRGARPLPLAVHRRGDRCVRLARLPRGDHACAGLPARSRA